jgi:hypothetical protein
MEKNQKPKPPKETLVRHGDLVYRINTTDGSGRGHFTSNGDGDASAGSYSPRSDRRRKVRPLDQHLQWLRREVSSYPDDLLDDLILDVARKGPNEDPGYWGILLEEKNRRQEGRDRAYANTQTKELLTLAHYYDDRHAKKELENRGLWIDTSARERFSEYPSSQLRRYLEVTRDTILPRIREQRQKILSELKDRDDGDDEPASGRFAGDRALDERDNNVPFTFVKRNEKNGKAKQSKKPTIKQFLPADWQTRRTEGLERNKFAQKHNLSRFPDESDLETKLIDTIAQMEGKGMSSYGQRDRGYLGESSWVPDGEKYNRELARGQIRRRIIEFERTGEKAMLSGNWNPKFIEYLGGKYAPIPIESVEGLKKMYTGKELERKLKEKSENPNWIPNVKRGLGLR